VTVCGLDTCVELFCLAIEFHEGILPIEYTLFCVVNLNNKIRQIYRIVNQYMWDGQGFKEEMGVPPAKAGGGPRSGLGLSASGCHGPM
jgi:hypothetical protein